MARTVSIGVLALLAGCVSVPASGPGRTAARDAGGSEGAGRQAGRFGGLDPGARELESLHFLVRGYSQGSVQKAAELAEADYNRIMQDTGLYSFKPADQYEIRVYGSKEEYLSKTGQPSWSGGVAVGSTLYLYDGPDLEPTLAHEMTHLIFYEYMRSYPRPEELRWMNEGLAVLQERRAVPGLLSSDTYAQFRRLMQRAPMPFANMTALTPASERERLVNVWYLQAESVVEFILDVGGRIGFSIFLRELRNGRTLDDALASGFPGLWKDLRALEDAWRAHL